MKQYAISSLERTVLFGLMGLGALCLILSYFIDPVPVEQGHHLRFWTNLLHNSAFFTGIAFTSIFVLAATIVAYSGWHTVFKRVWESMGLFLPIGLIGIAIVGIGAFMHLHHLYHWADKEAVAADRILSGKASFLNFGWYFAAVFIFGGVWYFFIRKFRSLSLEQDAHAHDITYPYYEQLKKYGAAFLPIAGFTSAAAIWLWIMSLDAHWYSTMFAWYTTASWWVSAVCTTILILLYLKSKGYYQEVTVEHLHDLGKFVFAFSVFWTYLWFSQYMLIWYANVGEETVYFRQRMGEFPVLFYGNLIMNFLLPFLILIRNDTKRKWGSLGFASALVLFGHWWDFFQMVKIGPYKSAMEHHGGHSTEGGHGEAGHAAAEHAGHAAETLSATPATDMLEQINKANFFHYDSNLTAGYGIPGLLELGIFLGFAAGFVYFVFSQLEKAALVPENDPFVDESLHHQVEVHEAH